MGFFGDIVDIFTGERDAAHAQQAARQTQSNWNIDRGDRLAADQRNREMAYEFAKHGVQWKTADARAAGISPIIAMGGQTHAGPTSMPGGSIPYISSAKTPKLRSDAFSLSDLRLKEAQIKNIEAQTKNLLSGQPQVKEQPDRPISGSLGVTSGLHQQYKVVGDDSSGYRLQNLETSEFEEDPMGWFQTAGRKLGLYGKGIMFPALSKRQKRIVRVALQKQKKIMEMVDPLPKGRSFKYDRGTGKWFKARSDGNLFMDEQYRKPKKYAPPHKSRQKGLKKKYDYIHITPKRRQK